jgi:hypothetical protein
MGTNNIKFDKSLLWPENGEVEKRSPFCERLWEGLQTIAFVVLMSAPIMLRYL